MYVIKQSYTMNKTIKNLIGTLSLRYIEHRVSWNVIFQLFHSLGNCSKTVAY